MRPKAIVRTRGDIDDLAWFDDVNRVPNTSWDNETATRNHFDSLDRFGFESDQGTTRDQVQHFVSVGVHLTTVRSVLGHGGHAERGAGYGNGRVWLCWNQTGGKVATNADRESKRIEWNGGRHDGSLDSAML